MLKTTANSFMVAAGILIATSTLLPSCVDAHCDTLNGPVVTAAKTALEKGDVAPVLKWVKPAGEAEIKAAFKKVMSVRAAGGEAKELADRWFFETLVRVHRAGEGAPYTGLKDEPVEPIIQMADEALDSGKIDALIVKLNQYAAEKIKDLFAKARAARKNENKSVGAGRESVEAYVIYVHYLEGLHMAIMGSGSHGGHGSGHEGGESGHEE